jgi:hypothetical protein
VEMRPGLVKSLLIKKLGLKRTSFKSLVLCLKINELIERMK